MPSVIEQIESVLRETETKKPSMSLTDAIGLVLAEGCGAGSPGGKGFSEGNTCQRGYGGGKGGGGGGKKSGPPEGGEAKKKRRGKSRKLSMTEEDEAFDEFIEQGGTEGEWADMTDGQQVDFYNENTPGTKEGGLNDDQEMQAFIEDRAAELRRDPNYGGGMDKSFKDAQEEFDQKHGALDEDGGSAGAEETPQMDWESARESYAWTKADEMAEESGYTISEDQAYEQAKEDWDFMGESEQQAEMDRMNNQLKENAVGRSGDDESGDFNDESWEDEVGKAQMAAGDDTQEAFDQEHGALDEEGFLVEDGQEAFDQEHGALDEEGFLVEDAWEDEVGKAQMAAGDAPPRRDATRSASRKKTMMAKARDAQLLKEGKQARENFTKSTKGLEKSVKNLRGSGDSPIVEAAKKKAGIPTDKPKKRKRRR